MIARRIALALFLTVHAPDVSNAQAQQQALGQFTDWSAFSANDAGGKVCFVISQPKTRLPDGLNRDPAYFFVTHWANGVRNEVSVQVGFPLKPGSTVDIDIKGTPFRLATQDQRGWSNGQDESAIIAAMRGGAEMVVTSTSSRGNVTTDTYSLKGVSAALDAVSAACL